MHKLIRTAEDTTQGVQLARASRWQTLAWLSLLAVVGCAPKSASVREAEPDNTAGAESAADTANTLRWSGAALPAAQPYTSEVPEGAWLVAEDRASEDNLRALQQSLTAACHKWKLSPDPRLAEVAAAVAHESQGGQLAPRGSFVSYMGHRVGLPEPTPQIWLSASSRLPLLIANVEPGVAEFAKPGGLTHCGGALITAGNMQVLAVAFSGRFLQLHKPVPRRIADGGELVLEATLEAPFKRPSLAVTAADGTVTRITLPAQRHIAHTLRLRGEGTHHIEILAEGRRGVAVIAVLPVLVGQAAEPAPPEFTGSPAERDTASVLNNLYALIDQDRKARNLKALERDANLTRIALKHSEDMDKHHFLGHTSKTSGDATDRVKRAGIKARVVLENIGRGYSAREIHEGLMASPGHRANLLHPEATHLGIGVVSQREGEGVAFIVTQLFVSYAR